ncbi:MAG TPA: FHA domain-containing protein [Lysobacter sp.]
MNVTKLVFPDGEHAQALLARGINRIGANADNTIVLKVPSMPGLAAEIQLVGTSVNLLPCSGVETIVNDHVVNELVALRDGDQLRIASVRMRIVAVLPASNQNRGDAVAADEAATRMMAAVPRYLLRGLSGLQFGILYPVTGALVIGRSPECDIVLAVPGVSRRHVILRPTPAGVRAEDLDSSNGVWINDQHVREGLLRPGDELRLESYRFQLVAPGLEAAVALKSQPQRAGVATRTGQPLKSWLAPALVGAAAAALGLVLLLWHI